MGVWAQSKRRSYGPLKEFQINLYEDNIYKCS